MRGFEKFPKKSVRKHTVGAVGAAGVRWQRGIRGWMLTQWRPRRLAGCDVAKNRTTAQPLSGPNRLRWKIFFITFVSVRFQPFSPPGVPFVEPSPSKFDTERRITVFYPQKLISFKRDAALAARANKAQAAPLCISACRLTTANKVFLPVLAAVVWRCKPQSGLFRRIK